MIDFEQLFKSLGAEIAGNQKRLSVDSALGIYCGLSPEGAPRLSFMSKGKAPKLESTKTLRISQGAESDTVYWTCFDLLQSEATKVYFTFCAYIIDKSSRKWKPIRLFGFLNFRKRRYLWRAKA